MPSVEEINYFRVTNREFEQSARALEFDEEQIMNLPKDAKVIDVGSGLDQYFARGIKEHRKDIDVISIDPTLGLNPHAEGSYEEGTKTGFVTEHTEDGQGNLKAVEYHHVREGQDDYRDEMASKYKKETWDEIQEKRAKSAKETGNVIATTAPELPFESESIDFIADAWGPGMYLERGHAGSDLDKYTENITRVLKPDGTASIYPIDFYRYPYRWTDEEKNSAAVKEFKRIFEDRDDVEIEFYEKPDPYDGEWIRIGIHIKKL